MAFTAVTVTRAYRTPTGAPARGTVTFTPITPMINGGTVVAKPVPAPLDGAGTISVELAATTDPDTSPVGAAYRVVERITGAEPRTYIVEVPHDAPAGAVDLSILAPAIEAPTLTFPVPGPQGPQGVPGAAGPAGGVTSVAGKTGAVTLDPSDVGAQPVDADLTALAGLGDGVPVRSGGVWAAQDPASFGGGSGVGTPVTLTASGGTITPNPSAGRVFLHDITTADATLASPAAGSNGQLIDVVVYSSSATRTLTVAGQTVSVTSTSPWWGRLVYVLARDEWVLDDGDGGGGSGGSGGVPDDGSVTDVKVATGAAISLDKTADSATRVAMSAAERTKLTGIAPGATANSADATLLARANHTGAQAISTVTGLQTALDAKAPLASPTFTGTVTLPRTVSTPVSVTYAATTTIDAAAGTIFEIAATGALALSAPSNPASGQQITVCVLASGASRTVTLNAAILLTTGLTTPITVPSGKWLFLGMRYSATASAWFLLAATQQA